MTGTYRDNNDEGKDGDGATLELSQRDASRLVLSMSAMPLANGPVTTVPDRYTSYPHEYGQVWLHDDHVSIEFQKSKCENGARSGSKPSAELMAEAWLDAHPGGYKTGRWPTRFVIRFNH